MATLTPNTFTNGKRLGARLWRLRQNDSTVEDNFQIKNPQSVLVFELRRNDISQTPQTFGDFDRNNSANAAREALFQLFLRTCHNIVDAHFQSSTNKGEFPIEMFLELALRPEGDEVVDNVDREAQEARNMVAAFIGLHYGKERFNAEEISKQQGSLNSATTESMRFMQGYDHRRVFSYRFYVVIKESTCDFSRHMAEVLEIGIANYKSFNGTDGKKKSNKGMNFAGGAGGGGGASANGGIVNQLQRGGDQKMMISPSSMPYSRYVVDSERWMLIHDTILYISAIGTYLRDQTLMTESVMRQCADMKHGLTDAANPACPLAVFSLNRMFESASRKDLPIDVVQKDISKYIRVIDEEEYSFTFPHKKLVIRIPIEKMANAHTIVHMFTPEVQKMTIEPHMDLQRSVGGGIERVISQSQSIDNDAADADVAPDVVVSPHRQHDLQTNSDDDEDADVDDKAPPIADEESNSVSGLEEMSAVTIDGAEAAEVFVPRPRERNTFVDNDEESNNIAGGDRLEAALINARHRSDAVAPRAAPLAVPPARSQHPLVARNAAIFEFLSKKHGISVESQLLPQDVPEIDASYLMNQDFGDARQMELAKTLTAATEEGGADRTDYHILRARIFHGACKTIAAMPNEKERTKTRLRMQVAAMDEYRGKCGTSVSNISSPMKAMMVWYEDAKRAGEAKYRCQKKFVEPTLSLFAHSKARMALALDEVECIYTAHTEIMIAFSCAKTAYFYVFDMRLHPLYYGPAGASKSEVLTILQNASIPATVEALTSESTHAGDTPENENDVIRIMHELPAEMVSKTASDKHVLESFKNHMTAGILTRAVFDKDPATGARRRLRITSEKQIAFCAATNLEEGMLDKAIRDRFIMIHQVKKMRPDCTIDQKMAQRANMSVEVKQKREDFIFNIRLDQFLYANVEKTIMCGFLSRPTIVCTPIMLARYLEVLDKRFGISSDRRISYKVNLLARVHTVEAACTWLYHSPLSPCYGKEVELWHLLIAEPWLKDTEEIAMYAIDEMRSHFFDPDQEQFFHALREWVLPDFMLANLDMTLRLGFRMQRLRDTSLIESVNARHQAFRVWKKTEEKKHMGYHGQKATTTTTQKINTSVGEIVCTKESVEMAVCKLTTAMGNSNNQAPPNLSAQEVASAVARVEQNSSAPSIEKRAVVGAKASQDVAVVVPLEMCSDQEYIARTSVAAKADQKATKRSTALQRFSQAENNNRGTIDADSITAAREASYDYNYVSFHMSVPDFARKVAQANLTHKGFREVNARQLTQSLWAWTSRKVTSKPYIPNPLSSTPPVIIDEDAEEETYDMIRIDNENTAIYIHTSLLVGEINDPHEYALRECASLYTPRARFISALPHDPSTPHLLRVREVRPRSRANISHSIQKMTREAVLMGFSRESACANNVEVEGTHPHVDEEIELDEEAERAKAAFEFDADRAPEVLARSLDDHATILHLQALGMPYDETNALFFNATLNDRVAREMEGNTIDTPLNYPKDMLDTLLDYKKNEEKFRQEFTDISIGDMTKKRTLYGESVKATPLVPAVVRTDKMSAELLEKFKMTRTTSDVELITDGLADFNAKPTKRAKKPALTSSNGGADNRLLQLSGTSKDTDMPPPAARPRIQGSLSKPRAARRREFELQSLKEFMNANPQALEETPTDSTTVSTSVQVQRQTISDDAMSVDVSEGPGIDRGLDALVAIGNAQLGPIVDDNMNAIVTAAMRLSHRQMDSATVSESVAHNEDYIEE